MEHLHYRFTGGQPIASTEARLVGGWFEWKPKREAMPEVALGNSGAAGEWRLCSGGKCRTLSQIFGFRIGSNVTTMSACP